jgi:NADPH-dependent 2,4-dienoyl-CoA reductase/sulfur reductase-like enzyme
MKHLILGNGPAGVLAAETLRRADSACEILLAGSEDAPPYSRMAIPYLLEGQIDESGTYLRKEPDHYVRMGIKERRGRAVALDTDARSVLFHDGSRETYDRLLVATGSHPIRPPIPGIDLPQVLTCWTLDDARAIARHASRGSRVVQLGAGFIGCIIMEALAARGVELTVVELGDRMVPRMMTQKAGNMIRGWVESKGIRVITQAGIDRIEPGCTPGDGTAPLQVHLTTGVRLPADLLIVSAGVAPNLGFLDATPVHVAKGVLVDDRMETSVPGIFAAGDVAEAPDLFTGAHLVSAIQPNAADQARVAALNMAGRDVRLPGVLAINVLDTLGLISSSFGQWWGGDEPDGVELVDADHQRYLSLQFQGDVLIGATAVGLTQHVGVLRGLIQNRTPLGHWKQVLKTSPLRFPEAYVACSQQPTALAPIARVH